VWNDTIQYSSEVVHYPCTSCLLPAFDVPSVTCLRLIDVRVICRVAYFQFPIHSAFLSNIGRQAAPALWRTIGFNTQYRTSNVAENLGRYVSCTESATHWKDFELILTVKMKTKWSDW